MPLKCKKLVPSSLNTINFTKFVYTAGQKKRIQ